MTRHPETHIVGPAHWVSYLVNGDASSMTAVDLMQADTWLSREGVDIIGLEPTAEPYFTWAARVHAPELDCDGAIMLDYRAREMTIAI